MQYKIFQLLCLFYEWLLKRSYPRFLKQNITSHFLQDKLHYMGRGKAGINSTATSSFQTVMSRCRLDPYEKLNNFTDIQIAEVLWTEHNDGPEIHFLVNKVFDDISENGPAERLEGILNNTLKGNSLTCPPNQLFAAGWEERCLGINLLLTKWINEHTIPAALKKTDQLLEGFSKTFALDLESSVLAEKARKRLSDSAYQKALSDIVMRNFRISELDDSVESDYTSFIEETLTQAAFFRQEKILSVLGQCHMKDMNSYAWKQSIKEWVSSYKCHDSETARIDMRNEVRKQTLQGPIL
jgi:hypothetical protein